MICSIVFFLFYPRYLNSSRIYHTVTPDMVHQPQEGCRQATWYQGTPHSNSPKDIILTGSPLSSRDCHTCRTQHSNSLLQCKDSQSWDNNHRWAKQQLDSHPCSSRPLCDMSCDRIVWHEVQHVWQDYVTSFEIRLYGIIVSVTWLCDVIWVVIGWHKLQHVWHNLWQGCD